MEQETRGLRSDALDLQSHIIHLELELKEARGKLALALPEISIPRLQSLGLSPQGSVVVDYIFRKGPIRYRDMVLMMDLPEDHSWTRNPDSFYAVIHKARSALQDHGISLLCSDNGYYFLPGDWVKLEKLIKEA